MTRLAKIVFDYNILFIYLSILYVMQLYTSVFWKAPLAQTASYLTLHSSLFGLDGAVIYAYNVTISMDCLLIGSRCIPNGTHTNHCWAHASKHQKMYIYLII